MKHTIEVNGIKLYAFHGCLPEEGKIGGHYTVDISLTTDFTEAAISDELIQTIDYCDINRIVTEEMAIRSNLLEHVGHRIIARIFSEIPSVSRILLGVSKLNPPIGGDVEAVTIEMEEYRS